MTSSRKKAFLNRLKSSKASESSSDNVPDWFFDESGEITHIENESSLKEPENKPKTNTPNLTPITEVDSSASEDGIFDSDIPPSVNNNSDLEHSKTMWQSDEEITNSQSTSPSTPKLDDTQPIIIAKENYGDLLQNSSKALEGGNTKFAFDTLQSLIFEKKYLPEVVSQLEKAIEMYPERCDFRLLLGEAYTLLEEKEKALSIFKTTQKFVSL